MDQDQEGIPIDQFYSDAEPGAPQQSAMPQGAAAQSESDGSIPIDQFYGNDSENKDASLSKYETTGQQVATVAENAAQGVAGPLATLAETKLLGVDPEDIKNRAKANPTEATLAQIGGFGAGMFFGASEAGVGAKLAGALTPEASSIVGKIGARALNNAIQAGFFQANNEVTKSILGEGDPNHAISSALVNTGAAFLFGGVLGAGVGGLSEGAGALARKAANAKMAGNFVHGFGASTIYPQDVLHAALKTQEMPAAMKAGLKIGMGLQNHIAEKAIGAGVGVLFGDKDDSTMKRALEVAAGVYIAPKIIDRAAPVIYKVLAGAHPELMDDAMFYVGRALQGEGKLNGAIDNVFDFGTSKAVDYADPAKDMDMVRDFIANGGVDNQLLNTPVSHEPAPAFAQGGMVNNNPPAKMANGLEANFPEQNVLFNAAKMRVSNYLSSKSPKKNMTKLPFDSDTRNPEQEREYEHDLKLAVRPLSILNEVKRGTLTPKRVAAFSAMYPEMYQHLSKQMTKKITDLQFKDGHKPPYHLRQSLSLFLGANLDSTMLPQNIAAAQAVFMAKKSQQAMPSKTKMSDKMGQGAMTPEQARTKALNKT